MKYIEDSIANINKKITKEKLGVHLILPDSNYIWEKFLVKLKKEWDVTIFQEIPKHLSFQSGLFKPKLSVFDYSKSLIDTLIVTVPNIPVIIRVPKDNKKLKINIPIIKLRDHTQEELITAFGVWLNKRNIVAEPPAIQYGLSKLDPGKLKYLLDYLGLRDGKIITQKVIAIELEHYDRSVFKLLDHLLFLQKNPALNELDGLLSENAPHKILATLLTLTKRIFHAMQAHKAHATPKQLAEKMKYSPGAAYHAINKVKSYNFNERTAMLLYNTLIGLTLKLRRTPKNVTLHEYMKLSLMTYLESSNVN